MKLSERDAEQFKLFDQYVADNPNYNPHESVFENAMTIMRRQKAAIELLQNRMQAIVKYVEGMCEV